MPRRGFKMPTEEQITRKGERHYDVSRRRPRKPKKVTCGAKKRGGGRCTLAAGWGTSHPGIGCCKLHGGAAPNHVKAAAKEEYRRLLGTPIEINPFEALLWCIRIRAGEVKWLSERIAELDRKDWEEHSIAGKQFHLYVRERKEAMSDLARFSQMAISLGIAERSVRLHEAYGESLARLIHGILMELHLTPEQQALAPSIVRRQMLLVMSPPEQQLAIPEQAAA